MRFVNHQSFPRWIHWFWITGIALSLQPHLLRSEEAHSKNSSTTVKPLSSNENSNVSVSHTISVVSVLYSSDDIDDSTVKNPDFSTVQTPTSADTTVSSIVPNISTSTQKILTSTTTQLPLNVTTPSSVTMPISTTTMTSTTTTEETMSSTVKNNEDELNSTTTPKPFELIRGGKEGRSLMVHAPVVVRVFDKNESDLLDKVNENNDISSNVSIERNASSIQVISDATFILREKESSILEVGERHGSLLTLTDQNRREKNNDEPSKESTASGMSTNMLIGIIMGTLLLMIIGTVGFGVLIYHEKFANKPQTLDDNYANSDSGGIYNFSTTEDFFRRISHIECGGFDIGRDTYSEEMYNLDNDSFLNSLEAMTFPSYSPDMNNRSTFSNDSGV